MTEEEITKVRNPIAQEYYGADYQDICDKRQMIIDQIAKEKMEQAIGTNGSMSAVR